MRTRTVLGLSAGFAALVATAQAQAIDVPESLQARPEGPGTQDRPTGAGGRVVPGPQAGAFMGGGFGDWGFGLGGRIGYTFKPGIYAGAQTTYYFGREVFGARGTEQSSRFQVGGELGYKLFPMERWELRPYVFVGPSVVRDLNDVGVIETNTRFVFYPALAAAYHFGNAFIGAEARMHIAPDPTAVALMFGGGLSF